MAVVPAPHGHLLSSAFPYLPAFPAVSQKREQLAKERRGMEGKSSDLTSCIAGLHMMPCAGGERQKLSDQRTA
ncbi:hypothetical protein J1614_005958 [Plenodomus biglobosus]|nr:hypothetical protein J1614_005958 [Plenodomus biglobosus]